MATRLATVFVLFALAAGCYETVPAGHYGICRDGAGFDGKDIERPGEVVCWGPLTEMYFVEVADIESTLPMSVLCKDSLNFEFTVSVLTAARNDDDTIRAIFENLTPDQGNTITATKVFDTYARKVVDEESRNVVSAYETSAIVDNRERILAEVASAITSRLEGSPVLVKRVSVNNLDFPAVVLEAQGVRARHEVEVETERSEQKKRELAARNRLRIAQIDYRTQLVRAAAVADSNEIIGSSVTPGYLAWYQIKVLGEAANGPNNWGMIPYTDHTNGMVTDIGQAVVAEQLREKLDYVREVVMNEDPALIDVESGLPPEQGIAPQ